LLVYLGIERPEKLAPSDKSQGKIREKEPRSVSRRRKKSTRSQPHSKDAMLCELR
jgi:hypothetical protein